MHNDSLASTEARDAALHRLSYELHQSASREDSSERTVRVDRLLAALATVNREGA